MRGLVADEAILIERLKSVDCYRLSDYLYTFRMIDDNGNHLDSYYPDTCFDTVWQRYNFDRQLRLIILDLIERIEIALKTKLTQVFSMKYGAFGYLDIKNLSRFSQDKQSNYWRLAHETSTTESCHAIKWTFLFTGDHIIIPVYSSLQDLFYF